MDSRSHAKGPLRQRGIATVEFAIVAPLLLLLMLATAELGRAFYTYNTLTKAVRDGARYASIAALNGAKVIDLDPIRTDTQNVVVYGNPDPLPSEQPVLQGLSTDYVKVEKVDAPDAVHVHVSAEFLYEPMFAAGFSTFDPVRFTMSASVTMRAL
ncbi:MAG: pilus assembly protein [Pseudomonadota bacterium]|nr:pilus assembly protein [Pseudomonadota bacterium]